MTTTTTRPVTPSPVTARACGPVTGITDPAWPVMGSPGPVGVAARVRGLMAGITDAARPVMGSPGPVGVADRACEGWGA